MSLVRTLPEKDVQAKVYDIPDDELSKYESLEVQKTTYDEGKDRLADGQEIGGGLQLDQGDVHAYGDICFCYFWWRGVLYYRMNYCNSPCP